MWPQDLDDDALHAIAAKVEAERAAPTRPIALLVIRDDAVSWQRFQFKYAFLDTPDREEVDGVLREIDDAAGAVWTRGAPPPSHRPAMEALVLHPMWTTASFNGMFVLDRAHRIERVVTVEMPRSFGAFECMSDAESPFNSL